MILSSSSEKPIGVVGSGNFGTVISNMLAQNKRVLLYTRNAEEANKINSARVSRGYQVHSNIESINSYQRLAEECEVIFPMIPSANFREMMIAMSPYLRPYHVMIHGTKGFDIQLPSDDTIETVQTLNRSQVKTMSEVIREESVVVRIGCLAGPNLSKELALRQPAAAVIASPFHEVIQIGKRLLKSDRFQVYENTDIVGVEIAGVLKNIIAIAAGALSGLGFGDNAKGLLISRGAVEMVYLGRALGGDTKAFLGLAGIGDLVTTCSSPMSRNFSVGHRLAKGEKLQDIIKDMGEVAEGVNTVRIAKKCADYYKVRALITDRLYRVLFEGLTVEEALDFLMRNPLNVDIDFI